jgi:CheY-like chemotaxis protein
MTNERPGEQFLANLSHKLRTPLNAILGWIYVLRQGPPGPELVQEGLDAIERNVHNQTKLLDDLLTPPSESALQPTTEPEPKKASPLLTKDLERKLEGISVVAVDDDPEARKVLQQLLAHSRAIATIVTNAGEALSAIERLHPDVLLCDIEMPGTDGYDLLRHLRSLGRERGGDTPAAALTAHARSEDRTRALETGFQLHVPKPVDPAELAAAVESLAHRHER